MTRWLSAIIFGLLATAYATAMEGEEAQPEADTARSVLKKEVVVTGSPLETTRDKSIHRIRLLDSTRIAAQQAVSLRDVLITELNVGVQQDAILGSGTSIQGIGGNGVKVLVDGVPVVGRLNGNIDVSQILLANADRVELVEGPMAVMYGSDAIGGVINVITRKPAATGFRSFAHGYMESVGTYNFNLGLTGAIDNVGLNVTGGRNLFDGWTADTSMQRADQWKPREQYLLDARISPKWERVSLDYDVHFFDEKILNRGEPRAPYGETAFDDEFLTLRLVNSATLRVQAADAIGAHGVLAFTHYRRQKLSTLKNLVTLETTPIAGEGEQDTTTINTAMTRWVLNVGSDTNTLNVTGGLEGTYEYMASGRLTSATEAMTDVASFAEVRWRLDRSLVIQAAGRLMWNSAFGVYAVPSLHTAWQPSAVTSFRASIAQGFRSPSLREMYLYFVDINHDIVGNPNLSPETSTAVNLSGSITRTGAEYVARVEPSAYYNDVRNMITLAQLENSQEFSYVNIGRMVTMGVQADVTYATTALDVTVGGVLAAVTTGEDLSEVGPTQFSPQAKLVVRWTLPVADLTLNTFLKYTGASVRNVLSSTSELVTQQADPFTMMDLTLGRSFFDQQFTASVGCKNLFDVTTIGITAQSGIHSSGGSQLIGMGRMFTMDLTLRIP